MVLSNTHVTIEGKSTSKALVFENVLVIEEVGVVFGFVRFFGCLTLQGIYWVILNVEQIISDDKLL